MPQPAHKPTEANRSTVEAMSGFGIPHRDISLVLRIDPTTLAKYYRDELDRGSAIANTKVAQNLFRIACGEGREAVTAAIFWCKTRLRWKEARDETPDALGKKEAAEAEARINDLGTEWAALLRREPNEARN